MWWKFRNALQKVHLWIGLLLSIPFILIGVSGSLIVLVHALPEFGMPLSTSSGDYRPLTRIIAAANEAAPEGKSAGLIRMPQGAWEPASVQLTEPGSAQNQLGDTIFVDPVSLEILGSAERRRNGEFMRFLTSMHLALMFPSYYGAQTVGWMGVAMCLFGLSGLILWWPKKGQWRSGFLIKRGTRGFRLNRDLHSVIGFWSLPVFMILSVSGVYLVFPTTFGDTVEAMLPHESTLVHREVDAATIASIPTRTRSPQTTPPVSPWPAFRALGFIRYSCRPARTAPSWSPSCRIIPARALHRFPPLSVQVQKYRPSSIPDRTHSARVFWIGVRLSTLAWGWGSFGRFWFSSPDSCRSCLPSPAFACGSCEGPSGARFPTVWRRRRSEDQTFRKRLNRRRNPRAPSCRPGDLSETGKRDSSQAVLISTF
jgi:hypothetical protein